MSSRIVFAAGVLTLCAFATVNIAAKPLVPFTGTWTGETVAADLSSFPDVGVVAAGSGEFSHLGRSTMVSPHTSNLFTGHTFGEQIFTAANGDTLTAYCDGYPIAAPDGSTVAGTLDCTITLGTGRFAGASGHYTVALHSTLIAGLGVRFATVATIEGAISSVGSNK